MKKTKKYLFYISIVFIIVLGNISSANDSMLPLFVALGLTTILAMVMPLEEILYLVSLLIAPNRVLTYGPISAPTIVIIIGLIRYISRYKIRSNYIIASVIFVVFEFISTLVVDVQLMEAIKTIVILAFLSLAYPYSQKPIKENIILYISIGCIISALVALFINPVSLLETSRLGFSASGQNVLGLLCGTLVLLNVQSVQRRKKIHFIVILLLLAIGTLTGSRTFLLEIAVGLGLYLIYSLFHPQKGHLMLLLSGVGVIVAIGFILLDTSSFVSNFLDSTIYRFVAVSEKDVSNGRFELWEEYWKVLSNNTEHLLLGGVNPASYNLELVAHNMIIEQLASIGIIGSICVFFVYKAVFKNTIKISKLSYNVNLQTISPLFSFLVAGMVSHTLLGLPQTMMLFSCLFALTKNKIYK